MTDKVDEIINDALGVKPKEIIKKESQPIIPRPKENEDIDSDYKYQRENFYNLVERLTKMQYKYFRCCSTIRSSKSI